MAGSTHWGWKQVSTHTEAGEHWSSRACASSSAEHGSISWLIYLELQLCQGAPL